MTRTRPNTTSTTPGRTAPRPPLSGEPGTAGAPPRSPGGGRARPPAAGGRPPASVRARASRTRPADTRPPSLPATRTARRTTQALGSPARPDASTAAIPRVPARPDASTTAIPRVPARPDASTTATPRVPAQEPSPAPIRRPLPTDVFADLLVAVLSGHRPVYSMLRHTRGRAYDELAWLAERGPLRTRGARPVVRDIGWCEPRPGAIEAFARIGAGDRLRAMAFRLELGQDLRWRCTAVELGGPRPPRQETD
ncbi:Rv3235 family protein [Streptomyces sp. NPDC101116]|uniref:Rv3235 family protein n=1 Tax=Streptomyces sp. NPDC101116 TaxID=3366107 RepID=UPI003819F2CD